MKQPSFDAAIEFARDLIRIPGAPGSEEQVARRVQIELEALGFHDVRIDRAGSVIGVAPGTGDAPAVMLSSHLDVVDVGDASTWEHPPFGGDIADGHLHGRGAMDIKGPLAIQTYAAAHFLSQPLRGDVIVAHTVLEERGGWGMEHLLEVEGLKPGAVVIGESTHGDVCIGHRGRAEIIVEARGVAGHASAPERARNPMYALPSLLEAIGRFSGTLPHDDVLGPSTLAPTAAETFPRSRNVIPDRAQVILDWRLLPGWTAERAVDAVRDALRGLSLPEGCTLDVRFATEPQRTYTGLTRERRMFTPGFLMDAEHPVVAAAARSVAESTGRAPALRPWTFATDGGHACGEHGIPTVGFAPGEERFAHTNRERLSLDEARTAFDAYPHLVRDIMNVL